MSVKISYLKSSKHQPSANLVLFTDEKYSIVNLKKYLSSSEFSYVSDLLKTSDLKKNLFVYELTSKKKLILLPSRAGRTRSSGARWIRANHPTLSRGIRCGTIRRFIQAECSRCLRSELRAGVSRWRNPFPRELPEGVGIR